MELKEKKSLLALAKQYSSPIYVYNLKTIEQQCRKLNDNLPGIKLSYACKANTNIKIIKAICREGFDIETVSPGEIEVAKKAGAHASKITFTCGSITKSELVGVVKKGVRIHLDSLHQVEMFGQ